MRSRNWLANADLPHDVLAEALIQNSITKEVGQSTEDFIARLDKSGVKLEDMTYENAKDLMKSVNMKYFDTDKLHLFFDEEAPPKKKKSRARRKRSKKSSKSTRENEALNVDTAEAENILDSSSSKLERKRRRADEETGTSGQDRGLSLSTPTSPKETVGENSAGIFSGFTGQADVSSEGVEVAVKTPPVGLTQVIKGKGKGRQ